VAGSILPAIARAIVVSDVDARSPLPKAMNRTNSEAVMTLHAIR